MPHLPRTVTRWSRLTPAACLALVACSLGCAKQGEKLHAVEGQVLLNGKPAALAQVTFHPVGASPDAPHPVGQTDDQGRFTLTTRASGDGAVAGEYRVSVVRFLARQAKGAAEGDSAAANDLPARYGSPEQSGLTATVAPGDNRLPPFRLQRQ